MYKQKQKGKNKIKINAYEIQREVGKHYKCENLTYFSNLKIQKRKIYLSAA